MAHKVSKMGKPHMLSSAVIPYDPGAIPVRPAPAPGDRIIFEVCGLPPIKTVHQSIRNRRHPQHSSFVALRIAAINAMGGRAWYFGSVGLDLTIFGTRNLSRWSLIDYLGGVMDTLGGSSGATFTYLPVIYQDDCQVSTTRICWIESIKESYLVKILFQQIGTDGHGQDVF